MYEVTVVNVGDGACSIVRCACSSTCSCPIAVIDCGNWLSSSRTAAGRLADALGADLARLGQIVVTHFDADHWGGLRELAPLFAEARAGKPTTEVEILYPALPSEVSRLPASTLALITSAGGTGVRAMELATAWRAVAQTRLKPVRQGSSFSLAGHSFITHWPPAQLPANFGDPLRSDSAALQGLARDLAGAGHSTLSANLEEAYEIAFPVSGGSSAEAPGSPRPEPDLGDGNPSGTGTDPMGDPDDDATGAGHALERLDGALFPAEFRNRFRAVARRLGRANNLLSLVFAGEDRGLIVFGDVQGWALRACLSGVHESYGAALAPHDGTVRLPAGFPAAWTCIAQAGPRHRSRWDRHTSSHGSAQSGLPGGWPCMNTADRGHVFVGCYWC